jgi:CheY-like chemotaxis protein
MSFRILITGKNRKIASTDISKQLEKKIRCTATECDASKSRLLDALFDEKPAVVLILVKDEDQNDVKVYDVISEYAKFRPVTVIVVADELNRKMFTRNSRLRRILFLPQDISLSKLCDRLNEIKADTEEEEERTQFIEYDADGSAEPAEPRKHILVVDDDAQQLVQIKEHLKEFYRVTVVNSGKLALRALERFGADLIFLDYLMPEMTGPETLTEIRKDKRFSDIPVVFLTGVSERETVINTIKEFKPHGYILKPTTKIDIITRVIEILG